MFLFHQVFPYEGDDFPVDDDLSGVGEVEASKLGGGDVRVELLPKTEVVLHYAFAIRDRAASARPSHSFRAEVKDRLDVSSIVSVPQFDPGVQLLERQVVVG